MVYCDMYLQDPKPRHIIRNTTNNEVRLGKLSMSKIWLTYPILCFVEKENYTLYEGLTGGQQGDNNDSNMGMTHGEGR